MRVYHQTAIWEMANIADMELPAATESDWHLDGNVLILVLTTLQPNIADMEMPAATKSGWHLDGNVLIPVFTTL